jgi:flavin reductase (DIM6/NTAB) family NADH-FMN oxidoreductase RutF
MSDEAKRNPHPDFKKVEAERPKWDTSAAFRFTQTASPDWKFGDGANQLDGASDSKHVSIDPNEESRPPIFNYKLLIAGISPRPIAFLSTRSADGGAANLAPFSFFNMVSSDPPMFVVGIVPTASGSSKDTLRNLLETRECVINIISETFIEAANATAVDAPYGTSEWDVSGLTPVYDTETVRCARVQESVFSIEAKVDDVKEVKSRRKPVPVSSHIIMLEGTRFWVREDALNEEKNLIDPAILRPMSRLGGITYGRVTDAIELPRVDFKKDIGGEDGFENIKKHVE